MRDHKPISLENHLANLPLFSDIDIGHIERIAKSARVVHAKKGDVLFRSGDPCTGFHLLVFGQIKLAFTSSQGTEKIVEIVQQGQSFGEAIMFLDKNYIVFAQALQDSMLIHVSKTAILNELEQDHNFAKKMLSALAKRTHDLMSDVEAYSLQSARQRIISYLLTDISQLDDAPDQLEFELSIGKGVIASRLNITQEHFSRVLHELSENGLIEVNGKHIRIPSVLKLLKSRDYP